MAAPRKQRAKRKKSANRRNVWLLILMTLLVIGSVVIFTPPSQKINQGLDIQGGLSVVLAAKGTNGAPVSADDMEKSRAVIESRVNALGASEAVVQAQGSNQILVQIPGLTDTKDALDTIGKTGKLEFARLDSFTDSSVVDKINQGQYGQQGTITDAFGNNFASDKPAVLKVAPGTYTPLVTGSNITNVTVSQAPNSTGKYQVNVQLDGAGTQAFAAATKDLAPTHGKIVIILDGEVQSAPAVENVITGGQVAITGNYSIDQAKSLETVLESGSLPVSFEYVQSQVVGPTLGQGALNAGVLVALIGLAVVMLYLLFFYRGLGVLTAAAMVVFAVLYLGILAALSHFGLFSLSVAGIAGIVLTIGMAADSSILTLERFREEIRMGRSVRAASLTGVRHAIVTSIDADLVTLVSALSLFFLATASVKGFGLTLALGIVCDILMMLLFKAPLIRVLAPRVIGRHPGFWGIKDSLCAASEHEALPGAQPMAAIAPKQIKDATSDKEASDTSSSKAAPTGSKRAKPQKVHGKFIKHDINFLGHRRVFLIIAAVLVCASLAVVGIKGLNFGIEFVGGTSVSFHNTGATTTDQMRDAFNKAGEPNAVIQTTNSEGSPGFLVRTTTTSSQDATSQADQVASALGISTDSFEVTTIGPDWGASVIQSSIIAFLVSIVLIIIYIAIRFEYKMGITAIVALLHDLILVTGIYALVGREVNPNTIAALLTILGYSLYDTVVVFHRINDNMKSSEVKCTFMTMANHSINQVLIRTINTTLTSLIPVLAMLFFGGETLKDFAFAMSIGLICGSYSSIAVAAPLYAMWKTREPRNAKLVEKFGSAVGRFEFGNPHALEGAPAKLTAAPKLGASKVKKGDPSLVQGTETTTGSKTSDEGDLLCPASGKPQAQVPSATDVSPVASSSHHHRPPHNAKRKRRPDKAARSAKKDEPPA